MRRCRRDISCFAADADLTANLKVHWEPTAEDREDQLCQRRVNQRRVKCNKRQSNQLLICYETSNLKRENQFLWFVFSLNI